MAFFAKHRQQLNVRIKDITVVYQNCFLLCFFSSSKRCMETRDTVIVVLCKEKCQILVITVLTQVVLVQIEDKNQMLVWVIVGFCQNKNFIIL